MIFARKVDDNLASLAKKLDSAIAENKDKKLATFINIIGEDRDALEAAAKKFASENKLQNVAVVVPVEFENGPANFGINPDAGVTAMLYAKTKVEANHAYKELDKKGVEAIATDVSKILK